LTERGREKSDEPWNLSGGRAGPAWVRLGGSLAPTTSSDRKKKYLKEEEKALWVWGGEGGGKYRGGAALVFETEAGDGRSCHI